MKGKSRKMLIFLFIIYVILSATGLVLFKLGTKSNVLFTILGVKLTVKMIFGILCYGLSFILWLYIVSQMNLTIAMPISVGLVNLLVITESILFLKEKLSLMQGIGIFTTILGVILLVINTSN